MYYSPLELLISFYTKAEKIPSFTTISVETIINNTKVSTTFPSITDPLKRLYPNEIPTLDLLTKVADFFVIAETLVELNYLIEHHQDNLLPNTTQDAGENNFIQDFGNLILTDLDLAIFHEVTEGLLNNTGFFKCEQKMLQSFGSEQLNL